MAVILGLDNGYGFTKDCGKDCTSGRMIGGHNFKSAISKKDSMLRGATTITVDGETYTVGTGVGNIDVDKTNSTINKVCTLYDLAINGVDNDYKLVVGLPISNWEFQHEKFRTSVMNYAKSEVIYQGKTFKPKIKDCYVYKQGLAALYMMDELRDCVLVDIGSLTVDICQIDLIGGSPHLAHLDTLYGGVKKLFSSVQSAINNHYGLIEDDYRAEGYLMRGLKINGVKKDLSFLKEIKMEFMEPIIDNIKLNYSYRTMPIIIHGGGSILLKDEFKDSFPLVEKFDNPALVNAMGYERVGELYYDK